MKMTMMLPSRAEFRDGTLLCWNAMGELQQQWLSERGTMIVTDTPEGFCASQATVGIEQIDDVGPGCRFYCLSCAIALLTNQ